MQESRQGNRIKNSQMMSSKYSRFSESKGLLPKAPESIQHKYVFSHPTQDSSAFCGCLSNLGETFTEIYVSPTQVISREQLLKHARPSMCAKNEKNQVSE